MGIQDLLVTPIYLLLFYLIAYWVKPLFTNGDTKRYYMPALTLKFLGALSLGLIYQFYYGGGDTFNYFHDSSILFESFISPKESGWKLIISSEINKHENFEVFGKLYWPKSRSELMVSKIGAILGLFSFNTYSSIALSFAFLSFLASWLFFAALIKIYPGNERYCALAIFFIPSIIFWGSGYMKDTIALSCLCIMFYSFHSIFVEKRRVLQSVLLLILSIIIVKSIRNYLLLAFLPPAIFWLYGENIRRIKNATVKYLSMPVLFSVMLAIAYLIGTRVTEGDARYDIENVGHYTKVNAEYLYYVSTKQGGSAYYLGELDGTIFGALKLAPRAILISLYGPQLWNSNNVVMFISAVENSFLLFLTLYVLFKVGLLRLVKYIRKDPFIQFSLIFTMVFGFAVGITSFNYGTLVRYKIPLLPFFYSALFALLYHWKNEKSLIKHRQKT